MERQSYGFATAISMVVGIVIGSGIFFKADDILIAVNGNVALGVLGFFIVGIGVLFGALSISYYALGDQTHSGLVGYSEKALGKKFAYFVGWITVTLYFPTFIITLAMVGAIYSAVLLGIESQLFISIATLIFIVASFTINIYSPKYGGKIQVAATVAKIIPLIGIGLIGTLFFTSSQSLGAATTNTLSGGKPFSALIAIAFAFDGWIVATNISRDLKDSERNLPRALAWGTIGIILIYCLYFFGITQIVPPAEIVALGDAHTEVAAQAILGPIGAKVITLFVIISVYGGLNGFTLAFLRMPKLLLDTNLMKNIYGQEQSSIEKNSILFIIGITAFYYIFEQFVDYGLLFANLETPFDISSVPITINYVFYLILFIFVNKLVKNESSNKRVYYFVISLVASLTAIAVIFGALQVNGSIYLSMSIIAAIVGIPFFKRN